MSDCAGSPTDHRTLAGSTGSRGHRGGARFGLSRGGGSRGGSRDPLLRVEAEFFLASLLAEEVGLALVDERGRDRFGSRPLPHAADRAEASLGMGISDAEAAAAGSGVGDGSAASPLAVSRIAARAA